ncbi:MAG: deoxyguanosinetriphosphate triphosphohydrolase [Bdellovibrionales bacterium]|nr:deoxyguanosinetriphosphate triphosphohydrolase [Bdellovibrionales bacterium]
MPILTRQDLEAREETTLAPYAMKVSKTKGRSYAEEKDNYRTDFQKDRDRILHCSAFRRMEYKTQVFVNHEGDHYRTRLTHSLEVSQIAKSVGRLLGLNEDLMEALVLSHDLGHTPFGHAGERILGSLTKKYGDFTFEHNSQSLRIVDVLEHRYPGFRGLNLSFEVREGIVKHSGHWKSEQVPSELLPLKNPPLEAQLIDIVDEIAYNSHDIDDGLSSQMIDLQHLDELALWRQAKEKVLIQYPNIEWPVMKYRVISKMMTLLIEDLVHQTHSNLKDSHITSVEDLRESNNLQASFSKNMAPMNKELKQFLWDHLYSHYRVVRMEEKAKRILTDLFEAYHERPAQIPTSFFVGYKEESKVRTICDYIAGMTDRFAIDEHQKLFDSHTKV